ncbi:YceI family protein [Desulfococcus sp.]|uniref:YceI family protein n=1 Tax=Desulfococcus sp. TaxID=2025834 RepID=UPI0035937162
MNHANTFSTVSAETLKASLEKTPAAVLIDVLPGDHFRAVHLPGAVNACVYEVTFPQQIEAITRDLDASVVLYGAGAGSLDAAVAAEKMLRMGYRRVAVFEGGLAAWTAAGHPLEGEQPDSAGGPEPAFLFEDGTYPVVPEASLIQWTGRNANGRHYGTVSLAGGSARVEGGEVTGAFEVDMTGIRNIDLKGDALKPVLIDHLNSDDFFFVKRFPTAVFTLRAVIPLDDATPTAANYEITGNLTLRGISRSIRFPATVNRLADGGFAAEAHFDIDRTRWGVIYGSARFFRHLGMHQVYDVISIEVRLVFQD